MRTAGKYLEIARVAAANRLVYLGDALSRPLFFAMILFVFVQLWRQVFSPDRPVVAGFTVVDTLWYLVMTEAIMLSAPRLEGRVDAEVKGGGLATLMGRPCNYVGYHIAQGLGETAPLLVLNLLAGSLVAWWLIGPLPLVLTAAPIVALVVLLAFVLHLYLSMGIALLAFWVEDAAPFFWIYSKLLFIVGGMMIPLDFFPDWLRSIAEVLPFRAILCGPARLFVHYDGGEAARLLLWQMGWIALFAAVAHGIFRRGVQQVQIHGG